MNKKIITVALLLLAVVVVFAACKKEDKYKVDYTVELDNGEIIEVYENEDGENFITNVDGDEIPVTTDEDGFADDIKDLVTEKATNKNDKTNADDKNEPSSSDAKDEPSSDNGKEEPSSNDNKDEPSSSDNEEPSSSESSGIEIGDDKNQGASINWEDIAGNKKP